MGNYVVTSQTSNVQFEYSNSTMIVQGRYAMNVTASRPNSYSGSCYRKNEHGEMGAYFGDFNGYLREGSETVKYSMSEMSRQDADSVWDAIDDIEPHIFGTDSSSEE